MVAGRKARDMNRSRRNRLIHKLEDHAIQERRKADRYKKKYQRLLKKISKPDKKETPRSKTRRLLRYCTVSSDVRRTLIFHNAVIDSLRSRYLACKSQLAKSGIRNLVITKKVKRCKVQALCRQAFGFSTRVKYATSIRSGSKKTGFAKMVKEFFNRDDVSRMTAGKRETVTYKKVKTQRRYILDSLENLHRKFLAENPNIKLSYALFCRMRPFWVLFPTLKNRETCLCKIHENVGFIADKLLRMHLLLSANLETLADTCSCDPKSKVCMFGMCQVCATKMPQLYFVITMVT